MIYEFKCKNCHITEEYFSTPSNKEETKCRICGAVAKRIISKNNFVLKGKGWAKDGYSKEK